MDTPQCKFTYGIDQWFKDEDNCPEGDTCPQPVVMNPYFGQVVFTDCVSG